MHTELGQTGLNLPQLTKAGGDVILMAYSHWQIQTWIPTWTRDSCTMQKFHIGSDSDSDLLIEMYVVGTEIFPWDRDLSLKWVQ